MLGRRTEVVAMNQNIHIDFNLFSKSKNMLPYSSKEISIQNSDNINSQKKAQNKKPLNPLKNNYKSKDF